MADRPVSLITGAGRGIGRGIALELAKLGHAVVVNYAGNAAAADECLQLVRTAGGDGLTVRADVADREDRARLVQATLDAYGRIDLLVNNAGVAPDVRADLLEASEASFDRLININLKGPYFLTQLVARQMVEQVQRGSVGAFGLPRIVTITSVSAYTASVNRGDYCVAKAGLAMLTALYAARLAEYGINVYEVRPGVIETEMTAGVKEKYDGLIAQGAWPLLWLRPDWRAHGRHCLADLFSGVACSRLWHHRVHRTVLLFWPLGRLASRSSYPTRMLVLRMPEPDGEIEKRFSLHSSCRKGSGKICGT